MLRRALWVSAICPLLAAPAAAQLQNDLLEVFTARVKPDKVGQFEALVKRMVAANRQNKGTVWLALEVEYGEGHTMSFTGARADFAAIERSRQAFIAAMVKTYGEAAVEQIFRDAHSSVESVHREICRRRWDLSTDLPANSAAGASEARWVHTTMMRARPGHGPKVEGLLRVLKGAYEQATPKISTRVLEAVAGQTGAVYYVSRFRKSLASFDGEPPLAHLLGEQAYGSFQNTVSESVLTTETSIGRRRPELSNPSEAIAALAPEFWRPKP
jgi:quinol monooxygenase YgiN